MDCFVNNRLLSEWSSCTFHTIAFKWLVYMTILQVIFISIFWWLETLIHMLTLTAVLFFVVIFSCFLTILSTSVFGIILLTEYLLFQKTWTQLYLGICTCLEIAPRDRCVWSKNSFDIFTKFFRFHYRFPMEL